MILSSRTLLLHRIDDFLSATDMNHHQLGRLAVNNPKAVGSLRNGGGFHMGTADLIHAFIVGAECGLRGDDRPDCETEKMRAAANFGWSWGWKHRRSG